MQIETALSPSEHCKYELNYLHLLSVSRRAHQTHAIVLHPSMHMDYIQRVDSKRNSVHKKSKQAFAVKLQVFTCRTLFCDERRNELTAELCSAM